MILFLSRSFLRRLQLVWKPSSKGFLIGDRNLYFFTPDTFQDVAEISVSSVDVFLRESLHGSWQLLGFLAPTELDDISGYLQLNTSGVWDFHKWTAHVSILEREGPRSIPVEIRVGGQQ